MKLEHQNDLTYVTQCPEVNCNTTYLGGKATRLQERVPDHAEKDKTSNMVKHHMDTGCTPVLHERLLDLNKGV